MKRYTTFVPDRAWDAMGETTDGYSPWIVGHEDYRQLEGDVLQQHFDAAKAAGELGEDLMNDFAGYLGTLGYDVLPVWGGVHAITTGEVCTS